MATQHDSTSQDDRDPNAEIEAAMRAIRDGLDRFFAGDWEADWRASEPMTAEELIASLTGGEA